MNLRSFYGLLLRLYPRDYLAAFGAEMAAAFDEAASDHVRRGRISLVGFTLAEIAGIAAGAGREWIAWLSYSLTHSNDYISRHCLPDPVLMRPAGVSWRAQYGWEALDSPAAQTTRGRGACINADQTFSFASPLKRLVILLCRALHFDCCA